MNYADCLQTGDFGDIFGFLEATTRQLPDSPDNRNLAIDHIGWIDSWAGNGKLFDHVRIVC
jgi:hypothetical protein